MKKSKNNAKVLIVRRHAPPLPDGLPAFFKFGMVLNFGPLPTRFMPSKIKPSQTIKLFKPAILSSRTTMYPAKLLLFGEHLLLLGAPAIAAPVPAFGGGWAWREGLPDGADLREFAACPALAAMPEIDLAAFQRDIAAGLFFDSNIPMGYGLGSSGALCAAVYDRYAQEKITSASGLKAIFARMESFFHGNSSGIDPLTSYLRQTILIRNKTEVIPVENPVWSEPPVVFLLDSRLPRQTGPLVQWFLEQSRQSVWREQLERELLPAHNAMVQGWLQGREEFFWSALRQVSRFQFEHFHPMVPATLRHIWAAALDRTDLAFKICGGGGGGFLLGFARHPAAADALQETGSVVFPFSNSAGLIT